LTSNDHAPSSSPFSKTFTTFNRISVAGAHISGYAVGLSVSISYFPFFLSSHSTFSFPLLLQPTSSKLTSISPSLLSSFFLFCSLGCSVLRLNL